MLEIKAKKREVTGKKVKNLRGEGQVPASVYGPSRKPENVILDRKSFAKVYKEAGMNKFITLEVEGSAPSQVLIKEVQNAPTSDDVLHVSLYEVDQTKKITATVPIEFLGISPAVKNNIGFLVTPLDTIDLRCLPKDLPKKLTVDISNLNEIGDGLTLESLKLPDGVEFAGVLDTNSSIAYIAPPQKELEEEPVAAPAEGEEGAEGAEGEKPEGEEGAAEAGKEGAEGAKEGTAAEGPKKE